MAHSLLRSSLRAMAAVIAVLAAACSSPPSELYVLTPMSMPPKGNAAMQPGTTPAAYGSSVPAAATRRASTPVVGVSVTVPEYLDRLDIVERSSANELKPVYSAQWGESLGVTATRAVTENLVTLLPSDDVIMLPSRARRNLDYEVNLDLTRFESNTQGLSTLAGRWSISDSSGAEKASGRVLLTQQASQEGYAAMAAAMSHNLATVSNDIAVALQRLPAEAAANTAAPRSRSSAGKVRR